MLLLLLVLLLSLLLLRYSTTNANDHADANATPSPVTVRLKVTTSAPVSPKTRHPEPAIDFHSPLRGGNLCTVTQIGVYVEIAPG